MLNFYIQKIENYLEKYNLPNSPENIYRPIDYFLKIGGKRLRPVLTLLATELGGGDVDNAIHAAISIELFHNFSLIHDDIMDDAPKRRGYATVHEKWNSNIAILSGDALLIRAYELISKQKNEHIPDLLKIFNKTAIELCEGQQMDMDFENRNEVTIDEYISMIRLKTSVLLGCALEFGFIISNQTIENRKKIYDFGVNLGIAFQIQDDILDLYGDPEKVGKQVGGDIKANKKTLLYLVSKNIVNNHNYNKLNKINEIKDLNKKVEETKEFYDKNGVVEETKKYLDFYHDLSIKSLKSLEAIESKDKLFHLVSYLFNRQS
ncbi:MAG: polyprenyl synthetase family protein [Bacteroidota bacterium]